MFSTIFLLFAISCSTSPITLAQNCDVRLAALSTEAAVVGETVRATGGPMTAVWDTAVYVGDTRTETVSLQREGCEECDTCKDENQCAACDDCDACDVICSESCVESVDFVVPEVAVGQFDVSYYNGHGQSNAMALDITAAIDDDDGTDTSGPVDTGSR